MATVPAGTRFTVRERVLAEQAWWVRGSNDAVAGYVRLTELDDHSPLVVMEVRRATRRPSALYGDVNIGSDVIASLPNATVFDTTHSTINQDGRTWVLARATVGGSRVEGYLPYWHAGTLPAAATGTWTVVQVTEHYRYAFARWVLRTLPAGSRVARLRTLTDTWGKDWTYVRTAAGHLGWVRTRSISGPHRQYVWNGRSPITQQYTNYWCVPASVQTELNIALSRNSTSYAYQRRVYVYGRANMGYRLNALGLDPQSWARALGYFSGGRTPYRDATYTTYTAAIKAGVKEMRRTGQPVGLLVYHGGHAWTMIGYRTTADPARTDAFDVVGVYVAAPFVRWTDPRPGTYYSDASFRRKMTTYWESERWTRWNGLYTIILPN